MRVSQATADELKQHARELDTTPSAIARHALRIHLLALNELREKERRRGR